MRTIKTLRMKFVGSKLRMLKDEDWWKCECAVIEGGEL